jgi:hypothetical protein
MVLGAQTMRLKALRGLIAGFPLFAALPTKFAPKLAAFGILDNMLIQTALVDVLGGNKVAVSKIFDNMLILSLDVLGGNKVAVSKIFDNMLIRTARLDVLGGNNGRMLMYMVGILSSLSNAQKCVI